MIVHQSDLAAVSRCMAELGYKRAGAASRTNSAAAFGSVMHHALGTLEREVAVGTSTELALHKAQETFLWYWQPSQISAICEPIPADGWLPRQRYGDLRERGVRMLKEYVELTSFDDHELLATEMEFLVPIDGTWDEDLGEPHYLAGAIDRLAVRHYLRRETVCCDDYKSGADYAHLRHNLQGTAYCYATTKREFWLGHRGTDGFGEERGQTLFDRFEKAGRRFTWISLQKMKYQDGGWRGPKDYSRFALAVEQFAAMVKADIYPMAMKGDVCKFCDFRGICGGTGLPDDEHGRPGSDL